MKELLKRPIAFHPSLARLFGGVNEALMWQQLNYWSDKGKLDDGWIYKTKEELEYETTLTIKQQDRARKNLETMGFLKTELHKINGAPTLHYQVDDDAVYLALTLIKTNSDYDKRGDSNRTKGEIPLYTESTTESTLPKSEISGEPDLDTLQEEDDVTFEVDESLVRHSTLSSKKKKVPGASTPLINWVEERSGKKIVAKAKARAQIVTMQKAGYDDEAIKACWLSLEADPWWAEKGVDFGSVMSQIDKHKVNPVDSRKTYDNLVAKMNILMKAGSRDEARKMMEEQVRPMKKQYGY